LRALKSVLVMAGALKRASPNIVEDKILYRALRDMNKPKFVYQDVALFTGLIKDLFPGEEIEAVSHPDLERIITADFKKDHYEIVSE
jgi:dynein heavy chain, axonemal